MTIEELEQIEGVDPETLKATVAVLEEAWAVYWGRLDGPLLESVSRQNHGDVWSVVNFIGCFALITYYTYLLRKHVWKPVAKNYFPQSTTTSDRGALSEFSGCVLELFGYLLLVVVWIYAVKYLIFEVIYYVFEPYPVGMSPLLFCLLLPLSLAGWWVCFLELKKVVANDQGSMFVPKPRLDLVIKSVSLIALLSGWSYLTTLIPALKLFPHQHFDAMWLTQILHAPVIHQTYSILWQTLVYFTEPQHIFWLGVMCVVLIATWSPRANVLSSPLLLIVTSILSTIVIAVGIAALVTAVLSVLIAILVYLFAVVFIYFVSMVCGIIVLQLLVGTLNDD